jgi:TPR repeat protein
MSSHLQSRAQLIGTMLLMAATAASAERLSGIALAHQAHHQGQYERSLALYEQLAAQGNGEAAERAGFMLMQGSGAYGPRIARDVVRACALLEQAAASGRPHAHFVLGMACSAD